MTGSELVSQISSKTFCICNKHRFPRNKHKLNHRKRSWIRSKTRMFVERAVFPGVGFVQIGDQRKILSNYNWQSSPFLPLSPRSCEDGFPSANAWEFKAAAQIDKFLFSCTEKTWKPARAINTSSTETFSQNKLDLEKDGGTLPPVMGLSEGPNISLLQYAVHAI